MTKAEAQERMNELNWQRDRIREEIQEADERLKRVIEEGRELLSEYPTLSLRAPKPVELPCGCMSPAKNTGEICPHHRRGSGTFGS
jgi:hypothetical protein